VCACNPKSQHLSSLSSGVCEAANTTRHLYPHLLRSCTIGPGGTRGLTGCTPLAPLATDCNTNEEWIVDCDDCDEDQVYLKAHQEPVGDAIGTFNPDKLQEQENF
jgi:hypothetical protein